MKCVVYLLYFIVTVLPLVVLSCFFLYYFLRRALDNVVITLRQRLDNVVTTTRRHLRQYVERMLN